jgi:hypothetical protein
LASALQRLKYAELVGEEGCFRIFIAFPSGPVTAKADQAFGGGVFESRDGQFALVFPAYFLEAANWASVPNGLSDGIEMEIPQGGP